MKNSDNGYSMTNKIDEAKRRELKDEFIHGFMDANGVRRYPTIMALAKKHDVPHVTLHRWSKKEDWQSEKNKVQTEYEEAIAKERIERAVENGKNLDDSSIALAFNLMSEVNRRLKQDELNRSRLDQILEIEGMEERQRALNKFFTKNKLITSHDLNSMATTLSTAQRVGKLALGQAQEISKVSANVTAPDSLREIIAELDELAAAKSSRAKHIIQ